MHQAQGWHVIFFPLLCKTAVLYIDRAVTHYCTKEIMMITTCVLCVSVGKAITHPAFIIRILTCNPHLCCSNHWWGRIPPACPVFLLHTALITVGLSSLAACGAIVCTIRVDYAALQMVVRSTRQAARPLPIQWEAAQGNKESGQTCHPISLPSCCLRTCVCLEYKHGQVDSVALWLREPVLQVEAWDQPLKQQAPVCFFLSVLGHPWREESSLLFAVLNVKVLFNKTKVGKRKSQWR